MKKLFVLLIVVTGYSNVFGQALESNNKTMHKNRAKGVPSDATRITYKSIENNIPSPSIAAIKENVSNQQTKTVAILQARINVLDTALIKVKQQPGKKTVQKQKKMQADSLSILKQKIHVADSLAFSKIVSDEKAIVADSLDAVTNFSTEVERNLLHLINTISFFNQSNIDSGKMEDFDTSFVTLITNLDILNDSREDKKNDMHAFESQNDLATISDTAKLTAYMARIGVYKNDLNNIKTLIVAYDGIWDSYVQANTKSTPSAPVNLSTLPFFNVISGLKDISASINIIGSNTPATAQGDYVEFGLYTGILNATDSANPYSLFVTETSNYAFYYKRNTGLIFQDDTAKSLSINWGIFYLNKPIIKDSTKGVNNDFNSNFFQGKLGLEYVVYKNLFSIYANANAIGVISNKGMFDQRFAIKEDILTYADFGIRMLLNPNMNLGIGSALKIYFDLNFIVNQGDVMLVNPGNNDVLIPNFRVGLRADLGKQ